MTSDTESQTVTVKGTKRMRAVQETCKSYLVLICGYRQLN